MLTLGRFFPNLIRRILQKVLITGKTDAPFTFNRHLSWQDNRWNVTDQLVAKSWNNVVEADIGCDRTSIYVVMSRTFQPGQLQSAWNLTKKVKKLNSGEVLRVNRDLTP